MPDDVSNVIYHCWKCDATFLKPEPANKHAVQEHGSANSIDVRSPTVPEYRFDQWRATVEEAANEYDGDRIPYVAIAEEHDLPRNYVAYTLKSLGFTPAMRNGGIASRVKYAWDDLSEDFRKAVLAKAYFPDYDDDELTELPGVPDNSGNNWQAWEKYGWMLAHPDIETPNDVEEYEDGGEEETVEVASMEAPGSAIGAVKPQGEPDMSAPSTEAKDDPVKADDVTEVAIDHELIFSSLAALVQIGDVESARELYDRVLEA